MVSDNVLFSQSPGRDLREYFSTKKYSKIAVLVDENTREHCYPIIRSGMVDPVIIQVKSGEDFKTIDTCMTIWEALTNATMDRHSCLVVLGGGVLGDMGGFCAATYKRGIDFVLIPTTLLAQADASIGGKLGVDFNHYKNHIGVFRQPALTLLHSYFLKTLSGPELRSGYAEVIKHTLIADKSLWVEIRTKALAEQDWDELIQHSVKFKSTVTTQDPTEIGLRKILNAGHTIGHALESHLLNTGHRILHGEAIAVGLIAEGFIALQRGMLEESDLQNICKYILGIYGKLQLNKKELEPIGQLIMQDKKNKDNRIMCVLLNGIGNARWDIEISQDEVKKGLLFYLAL